MTDATVSAVSPDSALPWTEVGAWSVGHGIHRIPLPLPMDGLRAVNVYLIETDDGPVLIDGGWALNVARKRFEESLSGIGYRFADIRRFFVTHAHRDHYTMASQLGTEHAIEVALGADEKPLLELLNSPTYAETSPFAVTLTEAGAPELAWGWERSERIEPDPALWRDPDRWLEGDISISFGGREIHAIHTPGHTPGHYAFVDEAAGVLFSGDHILPTITPSVGFTGVRSPTALGDYLASLHKVRALCDLRLLPAHGPVFASSRTRADELLAHHEVRFDLCRAALEAGAETAYDVARALPWTRREHTLTDMDLFNQGLAVMETLLHLDLLELRGEVARRAADGTASFTLIPAEGTRS